MCYLEVRELKVIEFKMWYCMSKGGSEVDVKDLDIVDSKGDVSYVM